MSSLSIIRNAILARTVGSTRAFSSTACQLRRRGDYIPSDLGVEHKPSMGGSSMGHLISELGATRKGMEGSRQDGMSEVQRTSARRVAKWMLGVPLALGTVVVGGRYFFAQSEEQRLKGMA